MSHDDTDATNDEQPSEAIDDAPDSAAAESTSTRAPKATSKTQTKARARVSSSYRTGARRRGDDKSGDGESSADDSASTELDPPPKTGALAGAKSTRTSSSKSTVAGKSRGRVDDGGDSDSTTISGDDAAPGEMFHGMRIRKTGWGRLNHNQTAIDFVGRRKIGFAISAIIIVATVVSLFTQGLNLGIDFTGGVSFDVPAANFTQTEAATVLADNGVNSEGARIQTRTSESGDVVKVQVGAQTPEKANELRDAFAAAADVTPDEVSASLVSSSWGSDITAKAIRALIIFLIVVAVFISFRFEWRMALAAILAMAHDVVISVGVYSIFQFIVTPATVIAFLTILGYSLYDTIVVFDRVRENELRFATSKTPYDDIVNISMNQVLMRSLTTSFSSIVPVISLLIVGAGIMGVTTLSEFAIALLVGMVTGAYSSIFVASPLLDMFKQREQKWRKRDAPRATGETLRAMVVGGSSLSRRIRASASADGDTTSSVPRTPPTATAKVALQHEPRPRKKRRR